MERKVQLDKVKISKAMKSVKKSLPVINFVGMLAALALGISLFWLALDFIRLVSGLGGSSWGLIIMVCAVFVRLILQKVKLSIQRRYEMTFKNLMAEPILKASFEDVRYTPEKGFSKNEVTKMNLLYITLDAHFASEDMIEAVYSGVLFKQSDLQISSTSNRSCDERDNSPKDYKGNTILVDGRLTRFPFKVPIKGQVQIGSRIGIKWKHYLGKKRVVLEDTEFNKNFDVFADDEHSAFYVLTPQVLGYFNSWCSGTSERIAATFDGEYLYVLRYGKGGVFKADMREPFNADKKEDQIYAELDEIKKLIKVLHLK